MTDIPDDALLTKLAEAFCAAPLPKSVCADPCATMPGYDGPRYGTNLLTVSEAKEVLASALSVLQSAGLIVPPGYVAVPRTALEEVRHQFMFYAEQHSMKSPPDTVKAEVNRQWGAKIAAMLGAKGNADADR